jgi:hypothetical protein
MHATARPWYREPWPWILMAGPATVIVAGAYTIWLAVASADGVVADDYYKQGLAINQTLQRDAVATGRALRADLVLAADGTVVADVRGGDGQPLPSRLTLRLSHPTRAGLDRVLALDATMPGHYFTRTVDDATPVADGRWHLILEDPARTWRLTGQWRAAEGPRMQLVPDAPVQGR